MKSIPLDKFREWGAIGGKKSSGKLTKKQRIERARKAGRAKGKKNGKSTD